MMATKKIKHRNIMLRRDEGHPRLGSRKGLHDMVSIWAKSWIARKTQLFEGMGKEHSWQRYPMLEKPHVNKLGIGSKE